MYSFDKIIDRSGTNAYKLDLRRKTFGSEDIIPLWVADMDFEAPPEVIDAIISRSKHPIYGYTIRTQEFKSVVTQWLHSWHKWDVSEDYIEFAPGVLPSMVCCTLAYTNPGDNIIIQTPVYPPFYSVVRENNRELLKNSLIQKNGRYEINFEELEQQAKDPKTKLLFLCNPHNPVGRVWTLDELTRIAKICIENDIIIISDEIHADLTLYNHKHIPFASLSEEVAQRTVVCMAPSKTFNIAGLSTSYVVIPNKELLESYRKKMHGLQIHMGNLFGFTAMEAAYKHGAEWLKALKIYLEGNINLVRKTLLTQLTDVKLIEPEATYLLWLDFSQWGMKQRESKEFLVEKAKVGLNDGSTFGKEGMGFHRLNIASPRSIVKQALDQIIAARKP